MKYGFALGRYFHFVTDLSGTAYPLKSNQVSKVYLITYIYSHIDDYFMLFLI
jgi:hypothetical protein